MAAATYCFKVIKRVGIFVILFLLTFLALFSIQEEEEEEDFSYDSTSEIYKGINENGKFVLLWTDPKATPFVYFGRGSITFREKSCAYTNCVVTSNRDELGDVSLFDAILFNGPQLPKLLQYNDLPKSRSADQLYVYANIESAQNYPLNHFNGYFNLTWTYKLDSDINWGYFVVKDKKGQVVAPKIGAVWKKPEEMESIGENLKLILKGKTRAVAWFATNCNTLSRREDFVEEVRGYLKNYSLSVDIFGKCGEMQCPSFIDSRCLRLLEKDYYFYFAFENSLSEDYVTEKVLKAYKHNTVPVVYGGANYSRFLPPGSYINARELGAKKLAATINHLMKNPEEYYRYFKWQRYYSFEYRYASPATDDYCAFCTALNEKERRGTHWDLKEWWNRNVQPHPYTP